VALCRFERVIYIAAHRLAELIQGLKTFKGNNQFLEFLCSAKTRRPELGIWK